jgi:hypothetical protein
MKPRRATNATLGFTVSPFDDGDDDLVSRLKKKRFTLLNTLDYLLSRRAGRSSTEREEKRDHQQGKYILRSFTVFGGPARLTVRTIIA